MNELAYVVINNNEDDIHQSGTLLPSSNEGAVCITCGLFFPKKELAIYGNENLRIRMMKIQTGGNAKQHIALIWAIDEVSKYYSYSNIDQYIEFVQALYEMKITAEFVPSETFFDDANWF